MSTKTHSKASQWPPIRADFDRAAALPAILRACYRPSNKPSGIYFAPFYRLFETVTPRELAEACRVANLDKNCITTTPVGRVFDEFNPSPTQLRSGFLWLLKHPDEVKNIMLVRDILHGNASNHFYLGDLLTRRTKTLCHQPPTKAKLRKKHDSLITYLSTMKCAPLHDLERIIGGDCRKILLDLRGLGYNIDVGVQGLGTYFEITISLN